jgi:hypothetical protein
MLDCLERQSYSTVSLSPPGSSFGALTIFSRQIAVLEVLYHVLGAVLPLASLCLAPWTTQSPLGNPIHMF